MNESSRHAYQDRRGFVIGLVATAAGCAGPARPRRIPAPLLVPAAVGVRDLPFVDFHTHLQKRVAADELVRRMDEGRALRMVLMPLSYGDAGGAVNDGEGTDEQARDFARRFPDRFVPFVGMQRGVLLNDRRWHHPDSEATHLLLDTEDKLRTGEFFGMGEFMLRFYPYTTPEGIVAVSDMDYPADSYLMRRFADLAARYRVPMVLHCEAEPEAAAAMLRLVEGHPDATIVWAHNCGRASAVQIREWLSRHPNLYADLGNMMHTSGIGYGSYWPRRTPWIHRIADGRGRLFPEMWALFHDFADRFFVGTDTAHARYYQSYAVRAVRWWVFFEQLRPETARKIAFQNAERLFRR